jgi:hypothetical protein
VDGRIILKRILKKYGLEVWVGFMWLRIRPVVGFCEDSNEILAYERGEEFLIFSHDDRLLAFQ